MSKTERYQIADGKVYGNAVLITGDNDVENVHELLYCKDTGALWRIRCGGFPAYFMVGFYGTLEDAVEHLNGKYPTYLWEVVEETQTKKGG